MSVSAIAAMSGVLVAMQSGAATGNGNVIAIPPSFVNHAFMITGLVGVTSGAITIETSNDPNDAGTWAQIVPDKSVSQPVTVLATTDLLVAYTGRLNFVRARISTTISGGGAPGVNVTYLGAKAY